VHLNEIIEKFTRIRHAKETARLLSSLITRQARLIEDGIKGGGGEEKYDFPLAFNATVDMD
jgi:hypothetical protein